MATTNRGDFRERVAGNIRAELARKDISTGDLEGALDLSDDSIRRRMTGKFPWGIDEIEIVAEVLDLDPGELTAKR